MDKDYNFSKITKLEMLKKLERLKSKSNLIEPA